MPARMKLSQVMSVSSLAQSPEEERKLTFYDYDLVTSTCTSATYNSLSLNSCMFTQPTTAFCSAGSYLSTLAIIKDCNL